MERKVVTEELVIVIAERTHNPTLLNPDFLRASGIVPIDWELAEPPVVTPRQALVIFQNGIQLAATPERLAFSEIIVGKAVSQVQVPRIAANYVRALPNLEYLAVGIDFRGYVMMEDQPDAAHKYVTETLLTPGDWQNIGKTPVRAAVNFVYTLERGALNLTINEAAQRLPDAPAMTAVLFSGNFEYGLTGNFRTEQLQSLHSYLNSWQADWETYQDIVNKKFIRPSDSDKIVLLKAFA